MKFTKLSWQHLQVFRLHVFMSVVIGVLFAMPDQTREIYRAVAQMYAAVKPTQPKTLNLIMFEVSLGIVGVLAVSLVLWFTARRAATQRAISLEGSAEQSQPEDFSERNWVATWLPRMLATTPALFAAVGVYAASVSADVIGRLKPALEPVFAVTYMRITNNQTISNTLAKGNIEELMRFNLYLVNFAIALVVLAGAVFVLTTLIDRPRFAAWLARLGGQSGSTAGLRGILASVLIVLALPAIMVAAVLVSPVQLPQTLGAIFIMCVFLVVLQLMLMQLQIWRLRLGVPFTLLLILAAAVFSLQDWNDNHKIRSVDRSAGASDVLKAGKVEFRDAGFEGAFKRWLNSRKDLGKYAGSRYPIYIVAAQGGGIYAAKHAASFLGELQDLCPGFGHHLFAVSGVSGGSVGAATFAGLTTQYDWARVPSEARYGCVEKLSGRRDEPFSFAVTEMFHQDLWSPLLASLLFPDFLQRFLPVPVPAWDRARALEYAIERSYDKAVDVAQFPVKSPNRNPLADAYSSQWNPEAHPYTPALLLNTTEVGTGRRRIISPFSFGPPGLAFVPVWSHGSARGSGDKGVDPNRIDPPLSAAAGLSARFPWITPSAHFFERHTDRNGRVTRRKIRVVDGAYFENSGVVTALDLIKEIADLVRRGELDQKIEINLLVFTSADFDTGQSSGLGEAVDPMRAVFNARTARAGIAIEEAITTLKLLSTNDGPVKADIVKLELNGYGYPLPLGWRLSPITRHLISLHNGAEINCKTDDTTPAGKPEIATASCVKRNVYDRLR